MGKRIGGKEAALIAGLLGTSPYEVQRTQSFFGGGPPTSKDRRVRRRR